MINIEVCCPKCNGYVGNKITFRITEDNQQLAAIDKDFEIECECSWGHSWTHTQKQLK